jgi:hypothetical protein
LAGIKDYHKKKGFFDVKLKVILWLKVEGCRVKNLKRMIDSEEWSV